MGLKNNYLLYPEDSLTSKSKIEDFCKGYFQSLGHTVEVIDKVDSFYLYMKIDDTFFKVNHKIRAMGAVQYKLPLETKTLPCVGEEEVVIKKIDKI